MLLYLLISLPWWGPLVQCWIGVLGVHALAFCPVSEESPQVYLFYLLCFCRHLLLEWERSFPFLFAESFYHERCWILLNAFSEPIVIYSLLNIVNHTDWLFFYVESTLHFWDKPHLFMVCCPFYMPLGPC